MPIVCNRTSITALKLYYVRTLIVQINVLLLLLAKRLVNCWLVTLLYLSRSCIERSLPNRTRTILQWSKVCKNEKLAILRSYFLVRGAHIRWQHNFLFFWTPTPHFWQSNVVTFFFQFLTPTPKGTANVLKGRPLNQIIIIQN